jgi:DNA-binding CsgD family transcriptional regulator
MMNVRDVVAKFQADESGVPYLRWTDGEGAQQLLLLPPDRGPVTVGRRATCDVPLPWDDEVSRRHALLEPVGEQWTLEDLASRNGSYVNGSRVHGRQLLRGSDKLVVGRTTIEYREPADPDASDSTARSGERASAIPLSPARKKVLVALCRPVHEHASATPAANREIADEVFLSVDAVKAHLRELFELFGLGSLAQNEKRARLARIALDQGLLHPQDF